MLLHPAVLQHLLHLLLLRRLPPLLRVGQTGLQTSRRLTNALEEGEEEPLSSKNVVVQNGTRRLFASALRFLESVLTPLCVRKSTGTLIMANHMNV